MSISGVWVSFSDLVPPFGELVLLKGQDQYGLPVFCIAYNESYRPQCNMTAVYKGYDFGDVKLPVYTNPSFPPTHWMVLDTGENLEFQKSVAG